MKKNNALLKFNATAFLISIIIIIIVTAYHVTVFVSGKAPFWDFHAFRALLSHNFCGFQSIGMPRAKQ
jgi:hypothetical protein